MRGWPHILLGFQKERTSHCWTSSLHTYICVSGCGAAGNVSSSAWSQLEHPIRKDWRKALCSWTHVCSWQGLILCPFFLTCHFANRCGTVQFTWFFKNLSVDSIEWDALYSCAQKSVLVKRHGLILYNNIYLFYSSGTVVYVNLLSIPVSLY